MGKDVHRQQGFTRKHRAINGNGILMELLKSVFNGNEWKQMETELSKLLVMEMNGNGIPFNGILFPFLFADRIYRIPCYLLRAYAEAWGN